ncbi:MAG TPA: ATP-binding protein [Micromonosporaceae bacterium]|nr:ATP-binding protein [Micromonosporaceae bacterium]
MADADPQPPGETLPGDASPLLCEAFELGRVTQLRHVVAAAAAGVGLEGQRLDDFVLAVNELITNAVRHGGGRGRLRLWCRGRTVLCEVSDHGRGMDTGQLGDRECPAPESVGGRGLWLARQLSDNLLVSTGAAGTTVRISTTIGRPTTSSSGG